MKQYSVFIVDDHKLFREGLKLLLQNMPYISEVKDASNGAEFLKSIETFIPDIVFMDIDMPVLNGIDATFKALEKYPDLNIVALSMYSDEDYYTQIISAGVKGFILKNSDIQEVELAIENVMNGKNYFSQEILAGLLQNLNRKKNINKTSDLSEREEEVLYHICKGLSNQEIADTLFLSKRTVDKHRENILTKTNSRNTAGLVMYAIRHGIVEV
ncbi:MAG: response regulator transcription factor [Bacteroidales bacterium]|nr:response regulator transcription factor [Bacteroidales bacterium]